MATMTAAELRNHVLQHMGVLGAGQSASSEDSTLVDEAVLTAYGKLRKFGLCPFASSAIPEWAQDSLRDYVAGVVGPSFGFDLGASKAQQKEAERELARQVAGNKQPLRVRADYF